MDAGREEFGVIGTNQEGGEPWRDEVLADLGVDFLFLGVFPENHPVMILSE